MSEPAYPYEEGGFGGVKHHRPGAVTLRDYFATRVIAAMLVNGRGLDGIYQTHVDDPLRLATEAYAMADAMVEARKS